MFEDTQDVQSAVLQRLFNLMIWGCWVLSLRMVLQSVVPRQTHESELVIVCTVLSLFVSVFCANTVTSLPNRILVILISLSRCKG